MDTKEWYKVLDEAVQVKMARAFFHLVCTVLYEFHPSHPERIVERYMGDLMELFDKKCHEYEASSVQYQKLRIRVLNKLNNFFVDRGKSNADYGIEIPSRDEKSKRTYLYSREVDFDEDKLKNSWCSTYSLINNDQRNLFDHVKKFKNFCC